MMINYKELYHYGVKGMKWKRRKAGAKIVDAANTVGRAASGEVFYTPSGDKALSIGHRVVGFKSAKDSNERKRNKAKFVSRAVAGNASDSARGLSKKNRVSQRLWYAGRLATEAAKDGAKRKRK